MATEKDIRRGRKPGGWASLGEHDIRREEDRVIDAEIDGARPFGDDAEATVSYPKAKGRKKAVHIVPKRDLGLYESDHSTGDCMDLYIPSRYGGGLTVGMVYCAPGIFQMGSGWNERYRQRDEMPHQVMLTKGFWLSRYPITRGQWRQVMKSGFYIGEPNSPERAYFKDCQRFLETVNESLDCGARLPTEAEWEYACRAGDVQDIYGADVCAVNAWGLCNMGLYLEWCSDWYGKYGCAPVTDPAGPDSGELRVLRGGAYNQEQSLYRYAARTPCAPECEDWFAGRHSFRLCCSI